MILVYLSGRLSFLDKNSICCVSEARNLKETALFKQPNAFLPMDFVQMFATLETA